MRLFRLLILGAGAISFASAGLIEIGASSSGGISTTGLTTSYITSNGGSLGNYTEGVYATNLFTTDTISGSSLGGSTTPTSGNGDQQFTDPNNGVTFAMLSESGNNYWKGPSDATPTSESIIIPIGLSGLTTANILLNNYYGVNGISNDDTVTFNFVGAGSVPVNLSLGNQIASDQNCISNSTYYTTPGTPLCTSFASSTSNAGGGSGTISTFTDVAWHASYVNTNTTTTTPFAGTSGTLQLDDISFNLSQYEGYTLTSITITDNNDMAYTSRLALSAISVSAPEPSTLPLLIAGLGVFGYFGLRRKVRL